MKKIKKALVAIGKIICNPYLLNHVLDEESQWEKRVIREYGLLNGLPVIDLADLFPSMDEVVSPYAFLDGSSTPADLALLRMLAKKYGVKDYLEIGTWRGESVANIAPLVKEAVSMHLPEEEMRKMGLTEAFISAHRCFSEDLLNVTHIKANSMTFDFSSLNRRFDMVFVDGDHHYEAVRSDTMKVASLIRLPGGIIVWHDYAYNPELVRWSVLAGILDGLPKQMHEHLYHISNTMCAVYLPALPDDIPKVDLSANACPGKYFTMSISLKKMKKRT